MNIPNLFKYVPLAAAAALALAVSPLQAAPHGGHGGGGGGHFGGGGRGGGAAHFHGGGGGHASFHGGGGAVHFHGGGGHVVIHGGAVHGGRFVHHGPAFRGRAFGAGPFWGVGVGWPYYGGYYDYGYVPDGYYDSGYDSGPAYSAGAVDTTATAVQQALANDGYYTGPIDGIIGSGTRGAISAYQRDHGLRVTGSIDAQLLSSLGIS